MKWKLIIRVELQTKYFTRPLQENQNTNLLESTIQVMIFKGNVAGASCLETRLQLINMRHVSG